METKTKTETPVQPELKTAQEASKGELAKPKATLSEILKEREIEPSLWRALNASVFPGADPSSILLVIDYCRARKLDVMKKPCHIVPMSIKNARTGDYEQRDIIMPGIADLRITASRTKEYLGHSKFTFGDMIDFQDIRVPEWCEVTVYRHHEIHGKVEYPWREFFTELVVTKSKDGAINSMWKKRPRGQLAKCTISGALRDAFPEEAGGMVTAEEMEGRVITSTGSAIDESIDAVVVTTPANVDDALDTIEEESSAEGAKPEPTPQEDGATPSDAGPKDKFIQDYEEAEKREEADDGDKRTDNTGLSRQDPGHPDQPVESKRTTRGSKQSGEGSGDKPTKRKE